MVWVAATLVPLVFFVVEILFGRFLKEKTAWLATLGIFISFCCSTLGLLSYVWERPTCLQSATAHHDGHDHASHDHSHGAKPNPLEKAPVLRSASFPWVKMYTIQGAVKPGVGMATAAWLGYRIDNITVLMFFMVSLIATCIHLFSIGYMKDEVRYHRFFAYLSLFCFSMFNLILADNFFQVFISWELVGVCSFLLIGFYYEKKFATDAANKAFITNRVGDVGFIIGLMILWSQFGTFQFDALFDAVSKPDRPISHFWLTIAGLGIFVGCMGKSAQFPLHVWLPDAMAGPTPVSALIHAATMVAAGVYLVARAYPIFTPEALIIIAYTGGITLFVAASIAIVATDIKKVLAYSTVSQLGYMMFALGIGGWVPALMHLITHAFFKALLFLCSGSVIYGCHHEQDMRKMGGLHAKMPITSWTMLIGCLAIAGAPLMSGFYSKDAIIAQVLAYWGGHFEHTFLLILPIVTAGVTAFYMFRMWYMTFTGETRDQHIAHHAHEAPAVMTGPLIILAIGAVICAGIPGWTWLENLITFGIPTAASTGEIGAVAHKAHEMHSLATAVASATAAFGVLLATAVYYWRAMDPEEAQRSFKFGYDLLANKWYFDELYRYLLVRPAMVLSRCCSWFDKKVIDSVVDGSARQTVTVAKFDGQFDHGIVDGLVNLVGNAIYGTGVALKQAQTGWLRGYVMLLAAGAVGVFVLATFLF